MEYNKNKLITDDGNNLVSQSLQEGQKVNFDSIIITDTPLPSDRQLSAMTVDNFKNVRTYPITNLKKGNNSVQPEAKLDNDGLTADYPIHAIGLLAHVGESNSELFGITQNSEGTPAIITKQSQTPYLITYDMAITVTNPDNYTATITPAGYVDQTTFDEEVDHIQTSIKNIDLSDAVKQSNNYTDGKVKDLDTQTSQGLANVGQKISQLLDISEIKKDVDNRFKGYQDDLDKKQDDVNLSVQNNKLYYNGTPVLIANAPNQPKLDVNIDRDTGNLAYQITPPSVDGGASISNYVISYRLITDDNWQTKQIDGNTLNGQVEGLQKGKNYQVKAIATNYAGKSDESKTVSILTATTPNAIKLNVDNGLNGFDCTVDVNNDGGATILQYSIYYKKQNDNNWQLITSKNNIISLSNIDSNIKYDIKAIASNAIGNSLESNVITTSYNNVFSGMILAAGGDSTATSLSSINVSFQSKYKRYKVYFAQTAYNNVLNDTDAFADEIINSIKYGIFNFVHQYVVNKEGTTLPDTHYNRRGAGGFRIYIMAVALNDDGSLSKMRSEIREV